MLTRRFVLTGLVAAPAIIQMPSLMRPSRFSSGLLRDAARDKMFPDTLHYTFHTSTVDGGIMLTGYQVCGGPIMPLDDFISIANADILTGAASGLIVDQVTLRAS
jgi:hypothetical protein